LGNFSFKVKDREFVMKILLATLFTFLFSATVYAENLPGGFITVKEDQIVWKTNENGVKQATLYGDPSKPPYTEILASQEFMWSAIFFLQE
jgi:hypothetical protein